MAWRKRWCSIFQVFLLFINILAPHHSTAGENTTEHELITLQLAKTEFKAEVVKTRQGRAKGMMFRSGFGKAQAMLFVFSREETQAFWMKNTFIPLSIGFFDRHFQLVDIQEMQPAISESQVNFPRYTSTKPAQFVLEAPANWFKRNNILLGTKLKGTSLARLKSEAE